MDLVAFEKEGTDCFSLSETGFKRNEILSQSTWL